LSIYEKHGDDESDPLPAISSEEISPLVTSNRFNMPKIPDLSKRLK
jgi:hypothetical protein